MNSFQKIFSLSFFFILLTVPLYSEIILAWPQGDVLQQLSGEGVIGATEVSITNMNGGNPAALSQLKGFNLGMSYQYDTKIKNAILNTADLYRGNYYPQAFGVAMVYRNFTFGLGSNQVYSLTRDYGEIIGTVVAENEQGYLDLPPFEAKTKEALYKNSLIVAYKHQLFSNNILSVGISLNHCRYYYENISEPKILENFDIEIQDNNFAAGFTYQHVGEKIKSIKLGIVYESAMKFVKTNTNKHIIQNRFAANKPQKLQAGFSIIFPKNIKINSTVSYSFWESLNKNYNHIKNQPVISCSVSREFIPKMSFSYGILVTDRKFHQSDVKNLSATYMIIGCVYQQDNFVFEGTIADSHLLSDNYRKHTIVKGGIGYRFDL